MPKGDGKGFRITWFCIYSIFVFFLLEGCGQNENPEKVGSINLIAPRVPAAELEAARKLQNPLESKPGTIETGRVIYQGQGICFSCHGEAGKGDGLGGSGLLVPPTDFTNPIFHQSRTDGELFWVIRHGVQNTGMIPYETALDETQTWQLVVYLRSLNGTSL